jgi:hypothetical protein
VNQYNPCQENQTKNRYDKRRNFPKINSIDPAISNKIIAQARITPKGANPTLFKYDSPKAFTVWLNTPCKLWVRKIVATAKRIRKRGLIALIVFMLKVIFNL